MERATLTGIDDIDNYVLTTYFTYQDFHQLCITCKWLYQLMYPHIYTIRRNHFIPMSGLIVPENDSVKRVYEVEISTPNNMEHTLIAYDIEYIDIRFGVIFEWYIKFKLKNVNTTHIVYSTYTMEGKLSKLFKFAYDEHNILSLYILRITKC